MDVTFARLQCDVNPPHICETSAEIKNRIGNQDFSIYRSKSEIQYCDSTNAIHQKLYAFSCLSFVHGDKLQFRAFNAQNWTFAFCFPETFFFPTSSLIFTCIHSLPIQHSFRADLKCLHCAVLIQGRGGLHYLMA